MDQVQGTSDSYWQIVAYDAAAGSTLWTARYGDSPSTGSGQPLALAVTPDGKEVVVTGLVQPKEAIASCAQGRTVGLRAVDGSLIWSAAIDNAERCSLAAGLAVLPDGSKVVVSLPTQEDVGGYAVVSYGCTTREYDARNGGLIWSHVVTRASSIGCLVALSEGGAEVHLATSLAGPSGSAGGYLVTTYDTDSGDERWAAQRQEASDHSNTDLTSIAVDPVGGQVLVTGVSELSAGSNGNPLDQITIAYDARTGAQRWMATATQRGSSAAVVRVDPHGSRAFVAGMSCPPGPGGTQTLSCAQTVAYDALKGAELWAVNDPPTSTQTWVADALVGPAEYTITAEAASPDSPTVGAAYAIVAHDPATGAVQWTMRYYNSADPADVPSAAAMAPDGGRIFVTGTFGAAECALFGGTSQASNGPACQTGTIAVSTAS